MTKLDELRTDVRNSDDASTAYYACECEFCIAGEPGCVRAEICRQADYRTARAASGYLAELKEKP